MKKREKVGTINMMEIALNQRKFTTSEISRGTYIGKSKKGKGSYTRKNKHKGRDNYHKDNYLSFLYKYFIQIIF